MPARETSLKRFDPLPGSRGSERPADDGVSFDTLEELVSDGEAGGRAGCARGPGVIETVIAPEGEAGPRRPRTRIRSSAEWGT
jgi:hypothetical protein